MCYKAGQKCETEKQATEAEYRYNIPWVALPGATADSEELHRLSEKPNEPGGLQAPEALITSGGSRLLAPF